MSDSNYVYQEFANSLQTEAFTNAQTLSLEEFYSHNDPLPDLILGIGSRACETALNSMPQESTIVFCTFLPSQTFQQLFTQHQINSTTQLTNVTATFMDQPLQRQILLARLIAPGAKTIGTVFGSSSVYQQQDFETLSQAAGFEAQHAFLEEQQNPVQILTPLIQKSDIFLSLPDSAAFSRNVTRWSLYITLRNRVPLIGFSASYSEAGAVVSMYTTTQQLAQQTNQVLNQLTLTKVVPEPAYPQEFTITINPSAARTLRLELPEADILSKRLTEVLP